MPVMDDSADRPRKRIELKYEWLRDMYAIVKLPPDAAVPEWAHTGVFTSVTRTPDELSIVCPEQNVPLEIASGSRWFCYKLVGPFPFDQVGVLESFIGPLAEAGVPIFTISTYDTDYVLVQEQYSGVTQSTLQNAGHELWPRDESWRKLIE